MLNLIHLQARVSITIIITESLTTDMDTKVIMSMDTPTMVNTATTITTRANSTTSSTTMETLAMDITTMRMDNMDIIITEHMTTPIATLATTTIYMKPQVIMSMGIVIWVAAISIMIIGDTLTWIIVTMDSSTIVINIMGMPRIIISMKWDRPVMK